MGTVSVLYAFDSEGNLAQRTDANGSVLSDHLFDAHGISLNGSLVEPFGYKAQSGYYTDNETGLHLLTHRYYDSATGRFLTRDPISYAGGINLYSHVANNPVNLADPSGLDATTMEVIGGGLGLAAVSEATVAAAPYVIIGGGIFLEYYAFWKLGECIAEQPWNPLTHPAPPALPPLPMTRTKEPWKPSYPIPPCNPPALPPGPIGPRDPDKEDECFKQCAPLMYFDRTGSLYRKCYRECRGTL